MHCVLTNFGTTGDLQPFLALALELRRHGHNPTLAFPGCYRESVERLELDFAAIGPESEALQRRVNDALTSDPEAWDSPARATSLLRPLFSLLPEAITRLNTLCRRADVLISGPAQPAARIVNELIGIAWVSVQFSHFGGRGLPVLQQASADLVNPVRQRLGLRPLTDPLTIDANSPQLALYAMSRHLRPRPIHWSAHYHVIGFLFLDDSAWEPDPELAEFIAAGDPPVVVSFGSMIHKDPQALTDIVTKAIAKTGCRGIVQHGWSGLARGKLPSTVLVAGYVPHGWLFPRAACIVHHGGSGTAAAVFRSGKPSVFVPHGYAYDQPYWAQIAEELGCSGPAIPFAELNFERLSSAISETLRTPSYHSSAAELAKKIEAEHGVQEARQLIEELVSNCGLQGSNSKDVWNPDELQMHTRHRRRVQEQSRMRKKRQLNLGAVIE